MNEKNKNIFPEKNASNEEEEDSSYKSPTTEEFSSYKYSPESLTGNFTPSKKELTEIKRQRKNSEERENFQFLITKYNMRLTRKEKIKKTLRMLRQLEDEEMKKTKKFSFK